MGHTQGREEKQDETASCLRTVLARDLRPGGRPSVPNMVWAWDTGPNLSPYFKANLSQCPVGFQAIIKHLPHSSCQTSVMTSLPHSPGLERSTKVEGRGQVTPGNKTARGHVDPDVFHQPPTSILFVTLHLSSSPQHHRGQTLCGGLEDNVSMATDQ